MNEDSQNTITPADALYGFVGWLTSRQPPVTFSSVHDAAEPADLVAKFCKANNLGDASAGFPGNLTRIDDSGRP